MKTNYFLGVLAAFLVVWMQSGCGPKEKQESKPEQALEQAQEVKVPDSAVSIRADKWFPYNGDPGASTPGFMIEIAQAALAKEGITIDYQKMPWNRAIKETRDGNYDAIVGAFKEDAPDFIFPDNELGLSKNIFLVKNKSTWHYKDQSSLESVIIGVIKDYSYGEELDSYITKYKDEPKRIQMVFGENALVMNLQKLKAGRIEALVENEYVLNNMIKEKGMEGQFRSAGNASIDNVYIAFSPKKPDSAKYARILSKAVAEMRNSGELGKILGKYGLKDWKK